MVDFATARTTMVDCQIRTVDVTDYDVIDAFSSVPREAFVPETLKPLAYIDGDLLLTGPGETPRYLTEAGPLAKLIQLAEIAPQEKVLVVGSATGYSAAVLSRLAASVTALEENAALAERARAILPELGVTNVETVVGPLAAGWKSNAPYDVIVLEGAIDVLPDALSAQLAEGGRIVAVVGSRGLAAKGTVYTRSGGTVSGRPAFNTHVQPLPGFAAPAGFVF